MNRRIMLLLLALGGQSGWAFAQPVWQATDLGTVNDSDVEGVIVADWAGQPAILHQRSTEPNGRDNVYLSYRSGGQWQSSLVKDSDSTQFASAMDFKIINGEPYALLEFRGNDLVVKSLTLKKFAGGIWIT